jgi:subfamily B ATP-binding cassette protein MsbA
MKKPDLNPYRPAAVYRRMLQYALPRWHTFALSIVGMVVFASTEFIMVGMIKTLTDGTFVKRDPHVIRWLPLEILGLFLLRGVAGFTSTYAMSVVGQSVTSRLRCQLFEHLLEVPVSHHDRSRSADLQAKLTYHAQQISDTTTNVVTSVIRDGLTAVGLLSRMLVTSWKLTMFTLLIAPLLSLSIRWVNRRFREISERLQDSVGGITHSADEAITGRRVVKIYGGERFAMQRFSELDRFVCKQALRMTAASATSVSILEFIAAIGVSLLVYLASMPDMLKEMTPGTFVAFIVAMLAMRGPISNMTGLTEKLQRGLIAGTDLFMFLDTPTEPDHGTRPVQRAQGALRYEGVEFSYDVGEKINRALDGVTLDIPAGKTVAFVGKSGSGKSTLLSLIPRFYDPDSGRVLLDGVDLRDYPLKDLRRQIALVDQNVVLFNASIADNIAYGQESASRERIEAAARRAYAWEFIESLPRGLDTPIGQNGVMLSGGQRQRIAIARALLKDAPILILDEATSALDTESERYIQKALAELVRGRTTLVIAHRLSTVQNADVIVVMRNGKIAEQGTHGELLALDGVYAGLYRMQFRDDTEPAAA